MTYKVLYWHLMKFSYYKIIQFCEGLPSISSHHYEYNLDIYVSTGMALNESKVNTKFALKFCK